MILNISQPIDKLANKKLFIESLSKDERILADYFLLFILNLWKGYAPSRNSVAT